MDALKSKKSMDFDVDEMLGEMKEPGAKNQELKKLELTEFDLLDAQIDPSDSVSYGLRQKL